VLSIHCTIARRSHAGSYPREISRSFSEARLRQSWHVIFNSAKGRQKDKNVRRDPRVAMALVDPENPYRYLEIRGRVVEITEEGASAHIDKMAKKYLGVDKYPYSQPGEVRVIYKIKPEHTTVMG
jgi:PPOX class probable F420-dependent enzyme